MAPRPAGVSGAAVGVAALGVYLVYAGIRNVEKPFTEGLRTLLRGDKPQERGGEPYQGPPPGANIVDIGDPSDAAPSPANVYEGGKLGLVGYAALAYPVFRRMFPTMTIYGRAQRPNNPTSDHPKGKALDLMTTNPLIHSTIIAKAKTLPGFKYYCSDLIPGGANCPGNRHRDHVHLSFH